jgi:phosphorylase kinase alpha/beta subunit
LEQAATEILVRQHALTLGRAYSRESTLTRPADSSDILRTIRDCNNHDVSEHIMLQELTIYLGMLIKSAPELFADMHTVRVGHILQLLIVRQQREFGHPTLVQAFNDILTLPPYQLFQKVKETLEDYHNTEDQLSAAETLHYEGDYHELGGARFSNDSEPKRLRHIEDWYAWREQQGSVGRENNAFYANIWAILHHCKGLAIGEKLNSKNRLDSEDTLSQFTSGEQSFKLHVSHLLNKIQAPVYRQLTVETIKVIASIFHTNESLIIEDTLYTDIIISHAVRINWLPAHPESLKTYEINEPLAWQDFYRLPPHQVANAILDALNHLLNND